MDIRHHPLPTASLGSQKTVTSLHFGTPGARPKVYLQASLHAEELPGMLVAHHLRTQLERAGRDGRMAMYGAMVGANAITLRWRGFGPGRR